MSGVTVPSLRETLQIINPYEYFAQFLGLNEIMGGRLASIEAFDGPTFTVVLKQMLELDGHSTPASWKSMGNIDGPKVQGTYDDPNSKVEAINGGYRVSFMGKMPLGRECVVSPVVTLSPPLGELL